MTVVKRRLGRRRKSISLGVTLALMAAALLLVIPALASHPEASLAGKQLRDRHRREPEGGRPGAAIAGLGQRAAEIRATDKVNGTGDNSYSGGVKEDTVCPGETTDSIPPNKSDLLSFHVYGRPAPAPTQGS